MLHTCKTITGGILWANLHLLFWLSLIPFTTGFMGENHFASLPAALYGAGLFAAAIAYVILQRAIIRSQGRDSALKAAVGNDWKGKLSAVLYLVAVAAAFWITAISLAIYVLVALLWLIPDRRIERRIVAEH
jgi:uncharacterized membrane protein